VTLSMISSCAQTSTRPFTSAENAFAFSAHRIQNDAADALVKETTTVLMLMAVAVMAMPSLLLAMPMMLVAVMAWWVGAW